MAANQSSSRARTYSLYTGAPRQLACEVVAALPPGTPLIPTPAEHAQLLLESEVLYQILGSQRHCFEFPFGIQYVEPTAVGLRLHLESNASLDSLLSGLLPCRMPMGSGRDEIYGLNGVRICRRAERGIELRAQVGAMLKANCDPDRFVQVVQNLVENALKYGAWSNDRGRVRVVWSPYRTHAGMRRLRIDWREDGGPAVVQPQRRGFGSRLIEQGLAGEMNGEVHLSFDPAGVRCTVDAPLPVEVG